MSETFNQLAMGAGPWPAPQTSHLRPNLRIRMPDGVELVGDLYLPKGRGPWPVIIERTPYGAAALGPLGDCYAAHGYLFLAVDVRGRFRSGGTWDPLSHEKEDGPAVIKWAVALPECNGKVGTRGHSYAGANQLMAAPHAGPALKAMVVYVAPGDAFDNVPFQGGAYDLSDLMWAWFQTGPTGHSAQEEELEEGEAADRAYEARDAEILAALHARPFGEVDVRLGLRMPFFREWVKHWKRDAFWKERSWLPGLGRAKVPALHISGWWDNNGRGSVLAHRALGGAAGGQRLILGPWDHSLEAPLLDDLPEHEAALVNRAALRDAFNDELAWFEQHLKGIGRSLPPAEILITGAWQWVEAADWPPVSAVQTEWFLDASGGLDTRPARPGKRKYIFDPANPNPINYPEAPVDLAPYDTSPDLCDDALTYRSPLLSDDVLAMGDVRVILNAATTARDVDWVARLTDEYPDGRSIFIRDGILRARFHRGFARPHFVPPGQFAEHAIDLWHVGHLFRKGHRIRVEIRSSARGRWDVNPGDGGNLATSTANVVSTQTISHGTLRGSRLLLPVVPTALLGGS